MKVILCKNMQKAVLKTGVHSIGSKEIKHGLFWPIVLFPILTSN